MGVKIRKLRGKWYLVIDYRGKRKTRVIGTDRKIAEEVRRQVEAKLALGDMGILADQSRNLLLASTNQNGSASMLTCGASARRPSGTRA
jgi:hypothetical protein